MSDAMQCDDCGKSTIFDHDASYRCKACCSQAYRDHHELYVLARAEFARQARTIRRLFTAYFLAKAKLRWLQRHFDAAAPEHNLPALLDLYFDRQHLAEVELSHCLEEREIDVENARREERARIVAGLRVFASLSANEVRLTAERLADAIERGEL